jgi:hypothetical protein
LLSETQFPRQFLQPSLAKKTFSLVLTGVCASQLI